MRISPYGVEILGGRRDYEKKGEHEYAKNGKMTAARNFFEKTGKILKKNQTQKEIIETFMGKLEKYTYSMKGEYVLYILERNKKLKKIKDRLAFFDQNKSKDQRNDLIYIKKMP